MADDELRDRLIGVDELVPTLGRGKVRYVNVDNAATTPAMRSAFAAVEALLPRYGSVHRGSGYNARVCTAAYENARQAIGRFVGSDAERDTVIFTKNTTEAINKAAQALPLADDAVVLSTVLEHHSNDLPWRARARTVHVGACADGSLDLDHLDHLLRCHAGRVALLAVTGASNVTGIVQPIHDLARRVHAVGGRILVDAAQLAPHRRIDMGSHDDPGHIDFVALSAHKLYAPFGSGALIGRRDCFGAAPHQRGGGTVATVTLDHVNWAELPDREEAGTPNLLGAVAFAAAARGLTEIGWDRICAHECGLLAALLDGLAGIEGVTVYGPTGADASARKVGVVAVTVAGVDHGLVAAALGFEHGVGVRSGCFCAQPYLAHLLGLDSTQTAGWVERARNGDKRGAPGLVRISLGLGNDRTDVDRVVEAVRGIANGDITGTYHPDSHGDYFPIGCSGPAPTPFSVPAP